MFVVIWIIIGLIWFLLGIAGLYDLVNPLNDFSIRMAFAGQSFLLATTLMGDKP